MTPFAWFCAIGLSVTLLVVFPPAFFVVFFGGGLAWVFGRTIKRRALAEIVKALSDSEKKNQ